VFRLSSDWVYGIGERRIGQENSCWALLGSPFFLSRFSLIHLSAFPPCSRLSEIWFRFRSEGEWIDSLLEHPFIFFDLVFEGKEWDRQWMGEGRSEADRWRNELTLMSLPLFLSYSPREGKRCEGAKPIGEGERICFTQCLKGQGRSRKQLDEKREERN